MGTEPDRQEVGNRENFSREDRPDGWLLSEWKRGDEAAATILMDRYSLRLIALVASRLSRRFRGAFDADDVVQSAMASFFAAAAESRIEVSRSVTLWKLLATFVRRKLSRKIERASATRRGADQSQMQLSDVESLIAINLTERGELAEKETLELLEAELPAELYDIALGVLAGQRQSELAIALGITERTVRRRLTKVRRALRANSDLRDVSSTDSVYGSANDSLTGLPPVGYNEFVLCELIAGGGFGKVYRAVMQKGGETVAVKFLRKSFWQDAAARASFHREISLSATIQHPGVLNYIGAGRSPHGGTYLLSEWIDGDTLFNVPRPTTQQFKEWFVQICEAVREVHAAGLVHGDLTPSNVMVDRQNRVVLTDFGFSQRTVANNESFLGGTIGFAAPEQIDNAFGNVSYETDIYAIGGIIHWYLFGNPPHSAKSAADSLNSTLHPSKRTPDARRAVNDGSKELFGIMDCALRHSPSQRTITLGEIIERLKL